MKRSPIKRKLGRLRRGIRPASKKRAAINEVAGPWREEFKREIGRCEKCLKSPQLLDLHELTGGWARRYTLTNRSCILVLCRSCHNELELCPREWPVARQAALLRQVRPADWSLTTLNRWLTKQLDATDVDLAEPIK